MGIKVRGLDKNTQAFLTLVRAGLWEKEIRLLSFDGVDFVRVMSLAQEQAVVGLVLASMEGLQRLKAKDEMLMTSIPRTQLLQWIGQVQMIEARNVALNHFVAELFAELQSKGLTPILMKGQGIAQCYERPLWRASGDVDLLLNGEEYEKAKALLLPRASQVETEFSYHKHLGITVDGKVVEVHGSIRGLITDRADRVLDAMQKEMFVKVKGGRLEVKDKKEPFRYWKNGMVEVPLMAVDEDVVYVFSHVLHHFFGGGIGLRQLCDWVRLLWTYRETIDRELLEQRISAMGLLSEWRVFAALVVECLDMPAEAMPLYSPEERWRHKAKKVMDYVMEMGNFGHNRDESYRKRYPYIVMKFISMWRHTTDCVRLFRVFPSDSIKVWWRLLRTGVVEL